MRSFRDPAGKLHFRGPQLIRQVYADQAPTYRALVESPFLHRLTTSGEVVGTTIIAAGNGAAPPEIPAGEGDLFLSHDVVPFPSFPAEWPRQMLLAAARLTLKVAEESLDQGLGLKDATPYNVLFRGPRPVFIDLLSFEPRDLRDPIWRAQAQFVRTFLLPLLVAKNLELPLSSIFLSRRDGIEPGEVYRMLGPGRRLLPAFLGSVSLPVWLSGKAEERGAAMYQPRRTSSDAQARFVLRSLYRRLGRAVERAGRVGRQKTAWTDYCRTCTYDKESFGEKSFFVKRFLDQSRPARVLDVGCNTGHFSRLAAARGAKVVAIDQDAAVIGGLWEGALRDGLDILPLVVDFARPTPALGWSNAETPSFLERSRGYFDAVFMLALMHHLVVGDQIPLEKIFSLAAEVTTRHLVIEYVAPDDPQFRRLSRGRDDLYRYLTPEFFEQAARKQFRIVSKAETGNAGRVLYLLERLHAR
ncbi:class I SAM-dependent methyltransferase [Geomesophilobacter sediminis]|uniref:Class I SAM-dependent methyltransferase n=1 Tax=Geomesophilobacter sediminis TaxID=2798584 RepID=A0A8J7M2Y3_9BACT|nr:class I SAM-dependent methyltransferase [Geomesophilobacter sediminis]MBJ6727662.1 class I SAM-dependent methyltransferase [Geomesophilobacter sediminis]